MKCYVRSGQHGYHEKDYARRIVKWSIVVSTIKKYTLSGSLVPRPLPAFQCCTLKNGRAWFAKSRAYDRAKALSMNVGGIQNRIPQTGGARAHVHVRRVIIVNRASRELDRSRVDRGLQQTGRP